MTTTTYRLTTIGDDGVEREAGIIGALAVPPNSILVISIPRDSLDADVIRLREEWRGVTEKYEAWKDVLAVIVRMGDVQFACLTRVEVSE